MRFGLFEIISCCTETSGCDCDGDGSDDNCEGNDGEGKVKSISPLIVR